MAEIVRRGRDFRQHRRWGAAAAVAFGLLFLWSVIEIFNGDRIVRPEAHWAAAEVEGQPVEPGSLQADALVTEVLSARTSLQRPREVSGPSPSAEAPAAALGPGELLLERPARMDDALPRAWAAPDEEMLEFIRPSQHVVGSTNVPYAQAKVFERPAGRDWRMGVAEWATHIGAVLIFGACFLMALTLAIRGRVPIVHGRAHRGVKRFSFFERFTHWMTAGSFVGLAITGIVIGYGVTLFRPFGEYALGAVGWLSTWGHMMFAPPFFLGVLLMVAMWTKGNLPNRKLDIPWLRAFGGFMTDTPHHPHARRFNAGQKASFWAATAGGLVMVATGVAAMFPFWWLSINAMGWVMLTHAVVGVLLIAFFLGHIYIGSVGMEGAFEAMWTGEVDRNWAAEHHDLWLEEMESGRAAADQRPGAPGERVEGAPA